MAQAPQYASQDQVQAVEKRLRCYPGLVSDHEVLTLRSHLEHVARGEAFLLQAGDCAESFADFRPESIRDNFKVFLQMAIVLTFGSKRPVVKVGRVAGQFAKPRSSPLEEKNGISLPSYRGDILNGYDFISEARRHDPDRMERAYFQSAAILNTLRSYSKGGFANLQRVQDWNLEFVQDSQLDPRYKTVVDRLQETISFMRAASGPLGASPLTTALETTDFFTSHEALLLNYEEALTRRSEITDRDFASSAHMLWVGERTRQLDGAHIEYARGIENPIGLKCGPGIRSDDLLRLIDRLNPQNIPGRLTLITRMGVERMAPLLPKLIKCVRAEGREVIWCCDPMHGNTVVDASGLKTRSFDDILRETRMFFEIHKSEGSVAGGVHLELTGKNVTECTGGGQKIAGHHLLSGKYETLCDPRLNATQALELAFQLVR